MATDTLAELVASSNDEPDEIIDVILGALGADDASIFKRGLSQRIIAANLAGPADGGSAMNEIFKWVGSWLLSVRLANDQRFHDADEEAEQMIQRGAIGDGMTSAELRARYRR